MLNKNLEITILEAIYGFCCNDIEGLKEIKSFICREFINGGLVQAEDKELLSSEVDSLVKFLKNVNCLKLVFFEDENPCFETTREFSEMLGYTFKGEGI